jgi:predicted DNA-binding protein (MmcQ/YjbR family)
MFDAATAAQFCATLPGATQDIKWQEHWVLSVGGKMFAMFIWRDEQIQAPVNFKADPERFLELTDRPGLIPAPYMARHRWIKVTTADALEQAELHALLLTSHAQVLAKLPARIRKPLENV